MTDTPPTGPSADDYANFTFLPRFQSNGKASEKALRIEYRDINMTIAWTEDDQGLKNLGQLFGSLPKIMESARREMFIRSEASGMDKEINDLFGDGE